MTAALIVDALAVFRLTRLIIRDELTAGLRSKLEHAVHQETRSAAVAGKLGTLIKCPWCCSPYVAVFVVSARRLAPRAWGPIAEVLAFSAVTGLVAENLD